MKTSAWFQPSLLGRWGLLLSVSLTWVACKPSDVEFQTFHPKSEVALSEIFNNTPAIRAAFTTIDPHEFNMRLDKLIQADPVMGVKLMHALGVLSKDNAALPQLADALSSILDRYARFYQATQPRKDEYNSAMDVVNRLLDIDPQAVTDLTYLLARVVRYSGENANLYPLSMLAPDVDRINQFHFPELTTWKVCDDASSFFLNSKPDSDPTDLDDREPLWGMYDMLRTGYCIYANRTGPKIEIAGDGTGATAEAVIQESVITGINVTNGGTGYTNAIITINASPGPGSGATATATINAGAITGITLTDGGSGYVPKNDDSPGAYMRNATAVLKNSGDVELRVRNLIYDLENKLDEYAESERKLADWTVNRSDLAHEAQVDLVDYMIDHVYPISHKDAVFNSGKEILDREAEHLTAVNPDGSDATHDKFLTEWILKALYSDAPKLDDLENFSDLDTNSKLYKFLQEMNEDATHGWNSITSRYSKSALKGKVFTGSTFTGASGPVTNFAGLLYSDGAPGYMGDGPIAKLVQVKSTQKYKNPFRELMKARVNSLVNVPLTYNNETFIEAAVKNFYFQLLDRFYDQSISQWALDSEEAQSSFGDPERNLQGYIAQMQYSMRNMSILDRKGKKPGDSGFSNVPYLTEFLYTIAAANGYVDSVNAPAQLTLQTCLNSMGATDIGEDGVRTINIDLVIFSISMNAQVTNFALPADNIAAASRNNYPYSASLGMFAFELLSPGRFIPRTDTDLFAGDTTNGALRGRFSPHQGDIESTNLKTSNWMMSELALSAWEGYGPYSVKGKAANGSKVKYENDFYTDGYRSRIATKYETYTHVAMGTNGGTGGSLGTGNGNYHLYEMIYRPQNSGDDCWADSIYGSPPGTPYPRYGYIRPQNNTSYWDTNNCATWERVRIDFDTIDEAIRANVEWNLKYKKYIFVIPMFGYTAQNYLIVHPGASFAVFSTIHGNGLWGVTTGHRAGDNGVWNTSGVSMALAGSHYIANSGTGFFTESPAGGQPGVSISKTVRMGVQSYAAGDSMVLLEMTMRSWDGASLLVDLNQQIWDSLGNGPVTPALIKDNFDSVLTLADALYIPTDVLAGGFNGTETNINKFRKFYDTFFPTDETTCSGGVLSDVAGGGPDLFENFTNGCGVTAQNLPPVPKVNPSSLTCNEQFDQSTCFKYPKKFKADGSVDTWYVYTGPSDGKLTGMLTALVTLFGTMHEDGAVIKTTGQATDTINGAINASRYTGSPMGVGELRDNVTIRNFCADPSVVPMLRDPQCPLNDLGYRVKLDSVFTALATLNETHKNGGNNLPQYETGALSNILSESAAGLRDGYMPFISTNKYLNVGYIDPLIRDLESFISDNVRKAEDSFQLTSGTVVSASGFKNKDRLRYFATKNAINPQFDADKLIAATPGIVQKKNHMLEEGDKIFFTTTGSLVTGLSVGTADSGPFYYVKAPVTSDTFRVSSTLGGGAIPFGGIASGVATVHQSLYRTNRFNQPVNGVPLNDVPINMMKQFVQYLRTLTSDVEIVNALKAAIPVMNNYYANAQNSSTRINITDDDIDHFVEIINDKNASNDYIVDSFLDMLVATKMDDLNTLRSFNFDQFKTLGDYQQTFDDMNDKIAKYFDTDIKKDLLYSAFMLGEPTCPGGASVGYYDHNEDGEWNAGAFTFISKAYLGQPSYTDVANKKDGGGAPSACTINTPIPNIYDKDYYMIDLGGVARNLAKSVETLTLADIDNSLNTMYGRNLAGTTADVVYGPNPDNGNKVECYIKPISLGSMTEFDKEMKASKNKILCEIYNKEVDEPHTLDGAFTDVNENGVYDAKGTPGAVNVREMVHYYMEKVYMPNYDDMIQPDPLRPNRNLLKFATDVLKDLLSPTICDANGLNCGPNSDYVTGELVKARSSLSASTNFTSTELKAVKNVVGNLLYYTDPDTNTGVYTEIFVRTGPHLANILREFDGDYNDLLNSGLEGFKPNGFLTYFSTNLTNKSPYTSLDILSDVRTLFNSQVMRCYPGITSEYPGGPAYCKKYRAIDTFWGQFGLLMDQFSTAAYNKHKNNWKNQMDATYYMKLANIFE